MTAPSPPAPAHAPALDDPGPRRLRWPEVPVRSRAEGPLWLLGGFLVAVLMTWPLVRKLGSVVPNSTEDPLAQSWQIAWAGHALLTQPMSLYNANAFWPAAPSAAFADSMLGYAPAAFIGSGPTAALVRYNLIFLFCYALVFAASGLLGRELGLRMPAAVVVAVAAAFTPTRMMQNNHLNVLSVGGIVLTVFLLVSGYRRGRPWQVLAGFAAAAWQLSIGFAMGIWFMYLLALLAAIVGVAWLRRGRPPVPRRLAVATIVGVVGFAAATVVLLLPYLQVIEIYPQAQVRERFEVEFFAPPPRGVFAAAEESRVWGQRTTAVRATLNWPTEQTLFPGIAVLVAAAYGLRWRRSARSVRAGLLFVVGLAFLLGFGPRLEGGVLYEAVYRFAPGWESIRTPGRLAFVWSAGLALLAGFGAQRLWDLLARRGGAGGRVPRAAATAAVLGLAALVAYEGSARLPLMPVLAPPVPLSSLAAPQLHFPSEFGKDMYYMHWSTDGFPAIANGSGSFGPPQLEEFRTLVAFPDAASVGVLRQRGIRTVVVHRRTAPGTPWEAAADKPVDGLGIVRRDLGEAVVFDL